MNLPVPSAPASSAASIPVGTRVRVDEHVAFVDRDLLSGGTPWRLLRLKGASRTIVERWRRGDEVRSGEERFARTLVQQGFVLPRFERELEVDEIDVVVPVYNDVTRLDALLGELRDFQVTVVDDGSSDAGAIGECARRHGATLLALPRNSGPAAARNLGASTTTRPFLWFIDSDVTLGDARAVAQRLYGDLTDPLVAASAPRVRGAGGPGWRDHFEESFGPLDMGERSALVVSRGSVPFVPSACLFVRRAAFGVGFDERLRVGEDVDFVWRLNDHGWLVRYDADVVVTHRTRGNWRTWWRQRANYGASTAALSERHGARLAPLRGDTWTVVAWASVLLGKPALGARIVRGARNHARDRIFASEENPEHSANEIVGRNMVSAGGPMARAVVRSFGVVVLAAALHPRLRRRTLVLFAIGTLWRWRHRRVHVRDLPLGVADDLAYGVGVLTGAWRHKTLRALTPEITRSSVGVREILGLPSTSQLNAMLRQK
jgi:mycofactocin system glycosyltransferase